MPTDSILPNPQTQSIAAGEGFIEKRKAENHAVAGIGSAPCAQPRGNGENLPELRHDLERKQVDGARCGVSKVACLAGKSGTVPVRD